MENLLISIITPVYNSHEFLAECIESVINQTYSNWELILVDDGSTDDSGRICDEYSRKDTRIKTIHKANGGQFETRLAGISAASGKYCTGLDSDDYLNERCVEELTKILREKEYDIIAWNMTEVGDGANVQRNSGLRYGEYTRDEFLNYVAGSTDHSFCNKLIKTELLKKSEYECVPVNVRHSEDYIMICPALCMAEKIITVDKTLYCYRQTDGSVTHTYSTKRVLDYLESTECIISLLSKYFARSDSLEDTEYKSLVRTVGYSLKRAYRTGNINRAEIEAIRANPVYKRLANYENSSNSTLDTLVFLKLFRLRLDWIITHLY